MMFALFSCCFRSVLCVCVCVVTSLHSTTCTVVLLYVALCVSTRSDLEQENLIIKLTIFKKVQVVHVHAYACQCYRICSTVIYYNYIYADTLGFNQNDRGLYNYSLNCMYTLCRYYE